jgi:hypothetical protein
MYSLTRNIGIINIFFIVNFLLFKLIFVQFRRRISCTGYPICMPRRGQDAQSLRQEWKKRSEYLLRPGTGIRSAGLLLWLRKHNNAVHYASSHVISYSQTGSPFFTHLVCSTLNSLILHIFNIPSNTPSM